MTLDDNNSDNASARDERVFIVRRRSRRLELIVASIALVIVFVYAVTHREQVDKPLFGAGAASASAPTHP